MAAMSRASPGRGAPADAGAVRSAPDGCGASPASEFGGGTRGPNKEGQIEAIIKSAAVRTCVVCVACGRAAGSPLLPPATPALMNPLCSRQRGSRQRQASGYSEGMAAPSHRGLGRLEQGPLFF